MAAEKTVITYWLCPAEPARRHLCAIINDLAARFEAPIFEPHVTIHVTDNSYENPTAVLEQALRGRGGFLPLSVRGVDYSDKFTKTVFVQFEPDADLTRLSSDLRRLSATKNDYELNPHLSLIYKAVSPETKRDLANSIPLPFAEVRFDSIKAVIGPGEINLAGDVEAWRVVAARQLV